MHPDLPTGKDMRLAGNSQCSVTGRRLPRASGLAEWQSHSSETESRVLFPKRGGKYRKASQRNRRVPAAGIRAAPATSAGVESCHIQNAFRGVDPSFFPTSRRSSGAFPFFSYFNCFLRSFQVLFCKFGVRRKRFRRNFLANLEKALYFSGEICYTTEWLVLG